MNSKKTIWLTVSVIFFITGCATIINGSKQDVGISSSPTGAKVTINNQDIGKTPYVASLKRKDNHTISIEMEGYQTYETKLTRKTSGWIAGNIVLGGLIGLAVDAITGSMYKLSPDQIESTLQRDGVTTSLKDDMIFFSVVLQPEQGWEKIGTLKKL